MKQIASDVYALEGLAGAGAYAVALGRGVALIDSGLPGAVDSIVAQLALVGYGLSDLKAIVLTHAHPDHVGNAAELARRSRAPVLAHRDEVPYIEGVRSLPPASGIMRAVTWAWRRMPKRRTSCKVGQVLEDGSTIGDEGELTVIHTPGHTPGSICLYQAAGRVLFCGDLLLNVHPLTGRGKLRFATPLFSVDMAQARESVRLLSALPIDVLCPGHGDPIPEGAGRRIQELLVAYES